MVFEKIKAGRTGLPFQYVVGLRLDHGPELLGSSADPIGLAAVAFQAGGVSGFYDLGVGVAAADPAMRVMNDTQSREDAPWYGGTG